MTEQSPTYIAPAPAKYLTLVFKITSAEQQTKLLAEGQWIASCHTDAMAERDALQRRVNSMEQEIERLQQRLINVNGYHQAWAAHAQELEKQLEAVGAGGVEPLRRGECLHQIVEPQPATAQEPMFWVRLTDSGGYEGPLYRSSIDDVRKKSGAWTPLYTAPQPPAVAPLEHDEDWLEQMYWEFDESRQKSGDERLRFKGFMRAYGTKCAHGMANLAQMEPCEDDEDESPRQIAAPQPPAVEPVPVAWRGSPAPGYLGRHQYTDIGLQAEAWEKQGLQVEPLYAAPQPPALEPQPHHWIESLPAMAREVFSNCYPAEIQKEIDDVIGWLASVVYVEMGKAQPPAPVRHPLTDERISDIVREAAKNSPIRRDGTTSHRIVRAVEAAHGITAPKPLWLPSDDTKGGAV